VLDDRTRLIVGVVTRRDLLDPEKPGAQTVGRTVKHPPKVVYDDVTLRAAADHMVNHDIGRLPVVRRDRPGEVVGMITRSDILGAHRRRLKEHEPEDPSIRLRYPSRDEDGEPATAAS